MYTFNPGDNFTMLVRPINQADPTAVLTSLGFTFATPPKQNSDCTWLIHGAYHGLSTLNVNSPLVSPAGAIWINGLLINGHVVKGVLTSMALSATGTLTQCHVYLLGFTYSGCDDPTGELKANGFTKFALYPGPDELGHYAVLALWESATTPVTGPMGKLNFVGIKDFGVGKGITSGPCQTNLNINTWANQSLIALNAAAKGLSNYLSANGCKCTDPQLAALTMVFQNAWNNQNPAPTTTLAATGQYGPHEQAALSSMGTMGVVAAPPCYSLTNDGSAPCDTPAGATGATGATGGPPVGATGATGGAYGVRLPLPVQTTTPTPAPAPSTGLSTGTMVAIGVVAVGAIGGLVYLMYAQKQKHAAALPPPAPAHEMYDQRPVEVTLSENPRCTSRKRRRRGTTRSSRSGSHPRR